MGEINTNDVQQKTMMDLALSFSAVHNSVDMFNYLLARGIDLGIKTRNNKSLLMIAAYNGSLEIVRILVENGANVNLKDEYGVTAFILATEAGHDTIADYLLKQGADPNLKYNHIQRIQNNFGRLLLKFKAFLWQFHIIKFTGLSEIVFG